MSADDSLPSAIIVASRYAIPSLGQTAEVFGIHRRSMIFHGHVFRHASHPAYSLGVCAESFVRLNIPKDKYRVYLFKTIRMRSTEFFALSFCIICPRWISTVRGLIPRTLAVSLLEAAAVI